jgi:hypothetical protein
MSVNIKFSGISWTDIIPLLLKLLLEVQIITLRYVNENLPNLFWWIIVPDSQHCTHCNINETVGYGRIHEILITVQCSTIAPILLLPFDVTNSSAYYLN